MHSETVRREGAGALPSRQSTGLPFSLVLGTFAGLAIYATSLTDLRDIDLYWHLLAGSQISQGTNPNSIGLEWTFAPEPLPWTSSQWLTEVIFFQIHSIGGWGALAAVRVLTAAIAIALLAWNTLRHRPRALAGFPFIVAMIMVAFASQERPQQATLIGAAVLGGVLVSGIVHSRLPHWWVVAILTILWANLHGGWILIPFVLGIITVGAATDHGFRGSEFRGALTVTLVAVAAGCLTPSGVAGISAAIRFSRAAEIISEWQPTEPTSELGGLSVLMLGLFALGWARRSSVPLSEVLAALALLVFSWSAWRNLAPGLALSAPLAAHGLTTAFPGVGRPEPRWSAPLGIATAAILTFAGVAGVATKSNLPFATEPIRLAEAVSHLPPDQRVLNDYNTSGVILYFGGPDVRVAIDGRSDRYGREYIEDYVGLMSLKGDWETLLESLDPTSALIKEDSALTFYLTNTRGWQRVDRENGYVLLIPPT